MFYMDVPWPIFAKTTFCKVYTNISLGYLASDIRILELLEKKDATTFRALVKPKKICRLLFGKFISIFRRNSEYIFLIMSLLLMHLAWLLQEIKKL